MRSLKKNYYGYYSFDCDSEENSNIMYYLFHSSGHKSFLRDIVGQIRLWAKYMDPSDETNYYKRSEKW